MLVNAFQTVLNLILVIIILSVIRDTGRRNVQFSSHSCQNIFRLG